MEKATLECATLSWVNAIRRDLHAKELPALRKGIRGDKGRCPVANSLSDLAPVRFGGDYLATVSDSLAWAVNSHTAAFDHGEYYLADGADDYWTSPVDSTLAPDRYSVIEFYVGDDPECPPPVASRFAEAFDAGEFPHLISSKEEA